MKITRLQANKLELEQGDKKISYRIHNLLNCSSMEVEKEIKPLYEHLASLIEASRQRVATVINSEITLLYWQTGKLINEFVLQGEIAKMPNPQPTHPADEYLSSVAMHFSKISYSTPCPHTALLVNR